MKQENGLINQLLSDLQDYNDNMPEPCHLLQSTINIYTRKANAKRKPAKTRGKQL